MTDGIVKHPQEKMVPHPNDPKLKSFIRSIQTVTISERRYRWLRASRNHRYRHSLSESRGECRASESFQWLVFRSSRVSCLVRHARVASIWPRFGPRTQRNLLNRRPDRFRRLVAILGRRPLDLLPIETRHIRNLSILIAKCKCAITLTSKVENLG